VLLALSAVAAAVLFALIARRTFGTVAARIAAGCFALGFCVGLLSGRVPYDLGFAIGLGAVLALMPADRESRRSPIGALPLALALALLASLASPVAGAFLALAGLAWTLAGLLERTRAGNRVDPHGRREETQPALGRREETRPALDRRGEIQPALGRREETRPALDKHGLALAAVALLPIAVLGIAYPDGGWEPFSASAFWPALAGVVAIALLLPRGALSLRGWLSLRVGAALYALVLIGAYAIHTPLGGNAARLGPPLAAPLLAGLMWERRRALLLALAPVLLYWQMVTPIRDLGSIAGDPSVHASYYAPLISELHRLRHGAPSIVEVPMTAAHWEAAYLPGHDGISLARGWERQLDTRYAALFYRPTLSSSAYREWLLENRVTYVALPDVRLDGAGRLEGALVASGLPYLRELWHSRHWRLYRVML
jgi:hypothetical protein